MRPFIFAFLSKAALLLSLATIVTLSAGIPVQPEDREHNRPAIILVPGAFHKAMVYDEVARKLYKKGYRYIDAIDLPSSGSVVPRSTDITTVQSVLDWHLNAGRNVVLVGNSYGATVIGEAVQGRKTAAHGHGRVLSLIMLSGFIPYIQDVKNASRVDIRVISPPFFRFEGNPPTNVWTDGDLVNQPPQQMFYNLLPKPQQDYWTGKLTFSAFAALNATPAYVPYTGDFPCTYVIGTQDNSVPPALAQSYINQPGAQFTVETQDFDHISMLSKPDAVVDVILRYVH